VILASGHRVLHFDRIDSTNAEAKRLAEAGERGPLWLWADEQTGGRGRLGRRWVSEPGNLYATFLLPCTGSAATLAQIGFVLALAARDAIAGAAPRAAVRIKWPNDLQIGGAKVCGLLCETVSAAPASVALGCGINVAHAPAGLPYPVTALADHGAKVEPGPLLVALDAALVSWLGVWKEGAGFPAIRQAWEKAAVGIGAPVEVTAGERRLSGTFGGLAEDGALVLRLSNGKAQPIYAGDVRFHAAKPVERNAS
jgi:BirA family biotin operon repressor/biotin-[acetyl-CoA-carboxylase] ligase